MTLVQIDVVFENPEMSISISGAWQLRDGAGTLIDRSMPMHDRQAMQLYRILGRGITDWQVAPESLTLTLDDWVLSIYDSSKQSESFSIEPLHVSV